MDGCIHACLSRNEGDGGYSVWKSPTKINIIMWKAYTEKLTRALWLFSF